MIFHSRYFVNTLLFKSTTYFTRANYTLLVLFVCYVCSFVDRQIISLLITPIKNTFLISDFQFSLIQGAGFALCYALAGFPLGRLADKHNRRLIIFWAVLVWSLMTCLGGVVSSVGLLFVARLGVAIGEAGLSPSAFSILSDTYQPKSLGFAISVYKMAIPVGVGVAMISAGVLYDFFAALDYQDIAFIGSLLPWQMTMLTVGGAGVLLAFLVLTIKEPSRVIHKSDQFADAPPTLKVAVQFLASNKMLYIGLIGAAAMLAICNYGISSWYAEFLQRYYGVSKSQAGSMFGTVYLVFGPLGIVAGPFLSKFFQSKGYLDAYVRTIIVCVMIAFIPSIIALIAPTSTSSIVLIALTLFFLSMYLGVLTAAVQTVTPNRMRGQVTALYLFFTTIVGLSLGSSVVAFITDFVLQDESMLNFSILATNAVCLPLALLLLLKARPPYVNAIKKAME